ncbi:MAG: hypothetical protein FGM32_03090 [Candidatus Kapabacteria bacterium]|nr:hypothetical protein [Candidatus Kapabacteria bacterium]
MNSSHAPRSNWGRNIVIVYSIFALSTLGFVAFAMTQRVDLTSADYYEQALRHDETVAALKRGMDAGVHVVVGPVLQIVIPQQMPIDGRIQVRLARADDPSLDRNLSITADPVLGIAISTTDMRRGKWRLIAEWKSKGLAYRCESAIWI